MHAEWLIVVCNLLVVNTIVSTLADDWEELFCVLVRVVEFGVGSQYKHCVCLCFLASPTGKLDITMPAWCGLALERVSPAMPGAPHVIVGLSVL